MKSLAALLVLLFGLSAAPRSQSNPVVEDWPGFLGPRRDGHSRETGLRKVFPEEGLELLWAIPRGTGYAGPAVAQGKVVYPHRERNEAVVVCLDAASGKVAWEHRYPCEYVGKFIRNSGARATPLIVGDLVFVHGVEGLLEGVDRALDAANRFGHILGR